MSKDKGNALVWSIFMTELIDIEKWLKIIVSCYCLYFIISLMVNLAMRKRKKKSMSTLELQCDVNVTWPTKTRGKSQRDPQFDHENKMAAPTVNNAIRFQSNLWKHWYECLYIYKIYQKQQTVNVLLKTEFFFFFLREW